MPFAIWTILYSVTGCCGEGLGAVFASRPAVIFSRSATVLLISSSCLGGAGPRTCLPTADAQACAASPDLPRHLIISAAWSFWTREARAFAMQLCAADPEPAQELTSCLPHASRLLLPITQFTASTTSGGTPPVTFGRICATAALAVQSATFPPSMMQVASGCASFGRA